MTLNAEAWNYSASAAFRDEYYKNLLLRSDVVSSPTNIGSKEDPIIVQIIQKGFIKYALETEHMDKLPILVTSHDRVIKFKDVFYHITGFKSAKFRAEKHHTFKQLVDEFIPFDHENQTHFTLWKVIVLAAYLSRLNIRVSTNPGFGKDSAIKALADMFGDVWFVANPTIAKMEYCIDGSKIVMLNEVTDLNADERRHMEQFFLSVGDFSNKYTKRSMPGTKNSAGKHQYDISKLSLIVCYNQKTDYDEDAKYFDNMFQKAVLDRLFPVKLSGRLLTKFDNVTNPKEIAKEHEQEFINFIRSIEYYKKNWQAEFFTTKKAEDYGFSGRYAVTVQNLMPFICAYAETDEETERLLFSFKEAHESYKRMIHQGETGGFEAFSAYEEKL